MAKRLIVVALVALSACSSCAPLDTGHVVNVAPSAEAQMESIESAVSMLNRAIGEPVFTLRVVDSAERRDNEIVVREADLGSKKVGHTLRTRNGVIVRIKPNATVRTIAHELCHAAGLGHVEPRHNLMHINNQKGHWSLTYEQLDQLRGYELDRD
jgi:hypothetical protein